MEIKKIKLRDRYLFNLLKQFWYAPSDSFLRAPEVAIWQSCKVKRPTLDIGCGDGKIDEYLFKGYTIDYGLDSNKVEVERANKLKLYKRVIVAGAEKMPFKNNSFNTVISNSTFEHIKFDIKAVAEVSRVLKPGGKFIFSTTTDRLLKALKSNNLKGEKLAKFNYRLAHYHYHSMVEWKRILNRNNLEIESYFFYFPKKSVELWLKLYYFVTFKPYKRELWSYLKDSPYGKLFPSKIITKLLFWLLRSQYHRSLDNKGCWIYIKAVKK